MYYNMMNMKYLLTFNIKHILVFAVLAFALLFTVTVSGIEQQSSISADEDGRSGFSTDDDYFDPLSLDVVEETKKDDKNNNSGCSIKNIGSCADKGQLVNVIYKNLFVLGGILGVFMVMFRGIAITIATAQGAVVKRDDAIRDFENVVIGLGLLALSYIILNTINPDILSFN